jgi:hypothetical protein
LLSEELFKKFGYGHNSFVQEWFDTPSLFMCLKTILLLSLESNHVYDPTYDHGHDHTCDYASNDAYNTGNSEYFVEKDLFAWYRRGAMRSL